jgi:uncharacterized protein YjbJ (UPF0337 family)
VKAKCARWGKLTNDDLEQIAGQRDKLVGSFRNATALPQSQSSD